VIIVNGSVPAPKALERLLNDKIFKDQMSWYHPNKRAYKGRDGRMHRCEYIALGC
jgi:hypothetical protein